MTNRTRYLASRQMRKTGKKHNRPEQMRASEILQVFFPNSEIFTDIPLYRLHSVLGLPVPDPSWPYKPDILIRPENIIIRMQGPYHETKNQRIFDDNQKILYTGNGFAVYDWWYDKLSYLWGNPKTGEIRRFSYHCAFFEIASSLKTAKSA